jgi:hypothetical protein
MTSHDRSLHVERPPEASCISSSAETTVSFTAPAEVEPPATEQAGRPEANSTSLSSELPQDDRRAWSRYKLSIPVKVTGFDSVEGEWQEISETVDVSRSGALVRLRKAVRHQTLLRLSLPLPVELRFYQHEAPFYDVYSLIRRIEPPQEGKRLVAVEFLGQCPAGFEEKPWATYQPKWSGVERRREPRQERYEPVMVEYFDESMQLIKRDVAVTENVSSGGTRIYAKAVPVDFTWIRVSCAEPQFESYAVLCNRYSATNGFERLCLRFLDAKWPM